MRRSTLALITAGVLVVSACTSEAPRAATLTPTSPNVGSTSSPDAPPTTSTRVDESTPSSPSDPSSGLSSLTEPSTTDVSLQPSPLGTSESPSTATKPTPSAAPPGPWPADFSAEQFAWAEAAWARFEEYRALVNQAESAPSAKDWGPDLFAYSDGEPYWSALKSIDQLAARDLHAIGFFKYEPVSARSATAADVSFLTCLDQSGAVIAKPDGQIFAESTEPRRIFELRMNFLEPFGWRAVELAEKAPEEMC